MLLQKLEIDSLNKINVQLLLFATELYYNYISRLGLKKTVKGVKYLMNLFIN